VDVARFRTAVLDALSADDAQVRLRSVAQSELDRGAGADELVEAVMRLRSEVSEEHEDELLDLLDAVTGWCSPGWRLSSE
jgi:hypothetical protein